MLENLYTIDWQNIHTSNGSPATYVPRLVQDLLSEDPQIREEAVSVFCSGLTYDFGCVAEATLYVLPFLLELLEYPDIPSHATILDVVGIFLRASAGEKYWEYAIALYHAIYAQQEVLKKFVDHHDVNARLKAFSLMCSFKEDDLELIGWLVGKIRVEHNMKAKARQLWWIVQKFSDGLSFSLYRMWCLEQAGRLLSEKNAWLQLIGALIILRINQEQTDAHLIDLLIDLIAKWSFIDSETSELTDFEASDFGQAYWGLKYLGLERKVNACIRLFERVNGAFFVLDIAWEILDDIFPSKGPFCNFSAQQAAILKLFADKAELWEEEPHYSFESHGLPTTRAEMQQLAAQMDGS